MDRIRLPQGNREISRSQWSGMLAEFRRQEDPDRFAQTGPDSWSSPLNQSGGLGRSLPPQPQFAVVEFVTGERNFGEVPDDVRPELLAGLQAQDLGLLPVAPEDASNLEAALVQAMLTVRLRYLSRRDDRTQHRGVLRARTVAAQNARAGEERQTLTLLRQIGARLPEPRARVPAQPRGQGLANRPARVPGRVPSPLTLEDLEATRVQGGFPDAGAEFGDFDAIQADLRRLRAHRAEVHPMVVERHQRLKPLLSRVGEDGDEPGEGEPVIGVRPVFLRALAELRPGEPFGLQGLGDEEFEIARAFQGVQRRVAAHLELLEAGIAGLERDVAQFEEALANVVDANAGLRRRLETMPPPTPRAPEGEDPESQSLWARLLRLRGEEP